MIVFLWFIAAFYLITVACWWYAWHLQSAPGMDELVLPPVAEWPADHPAPSLAVVIACHNEEAGIEACLRDLLQQPYPNLEIIVANDRSTDRTGDILDRLAREDSRIKVVSISELPPGWIGKTHALSKAMTHCNADYILFVDSDITLSPHALTTVMDKVRRDDLDFFSLWPYSELRSFWERLLVPPTMIVLGFWAMPRTLRINVASDTIQGNGQFLLVKRSSYEAIGGHAGVAAELAEDAVLATKAHAAGQRCWSALGKGLYVTYREGDFKRTANSIARVIVGSLQTQSRVFAGTQLLFGGVFPVAWLLPVSAICLWLGLDQPLCATFLVLSALHWVGMSLTVRRALDKMLTRPASVLLFSVGALVCTGILLWCSYLLSGKGSVRWGSTRYRLKGSQIVSVTSKG